MKHAITLSLLLLATPALTQEFYTFSAEQVAELDAARLRHNAEVCAAARPSRSTEPLPPDCTQQDIDAAPRADGTIYPDTARGREDFGHEVFWAEVFTAATEKSREDRRKSNEELWCGLDRGSKDRACVEVGAAAGCELFECDAGLGPGRSR